MMSFAAEGDDGGHDIVVVGGTAAPSLNLQLVASTTSPRRSSQDVLCHVLGCRLMIPDYIVYCINLWAA